MACAWKDNWEETKRHFCHWWCREGLVLGTWGHLRDGKPREEVEDPGWVEDVTERYTNPEWRTASNHYGLARGRFPADTLPIANVGLGPGTLATYLGSEPEFVEGTVWYHPIEEDAPDPEEWPPFEFDPDSRWWQLTETALRRQADLADGRYLVGCPDLIENIDILASLRGTQPMLMDMATRPEWVDRKMEEITDAWIEAYDRIYEIIKLEDGSSAFWAFMIWGPGKTAKLQCDAGAMISPEMFERFIVPGLTEQCRHTDYSMFHLDGHQCIPHLDLLLDIEELDAIEWTPDPQVPQGGDPEWYDMYRRILDAGKSVQALVPRTDRIVPLLDAVGGAGMCVLTQFEDEAAAEELARAVEPYRK